MTSKEFTKISQFYGKYYNCQMRGHVWLFPEAINEMHTPSLSAKSSSWQGKTIYLKPVRMRIEGVHFRIQDPNNGLINIHRKYVQAVLLYNYNH